MPLRPLARRAVRYFIAAVALLLSAAPAAGATKRLDRAKRRHHPTDLASQVDPFVGTAAGGNTFPGPVLPAGMIQLGPDTVPTGSPPTGGLQPSGYDYGASQLRGFSLDRMSGAGCEEYEDVPITPATVPITSSPVSSPSSSTVDSSYLLGFSHRQEQASPGYYGVLLHPATGPGPIDAQLTSATRSAMLRLTYPGAAAHQTVIVNAAGSATGNQTASVHIDTADGLITGATTSGGFCASPDHYTVYFAIRFSRPFATYGTWRGQTLVPGSTDNSDTGVSQPVTAYLFGDDPRAQTGAYVSFDPRGGRTLDLKVAISYVSVAGAERNLQTEIGNLGFSQVRVRARAAWNRALGVIQLRGGPLALRRRFYTALYQALIEPSTFSDVDGRYIGMDGRVHIASGYVQYANFSGWDIYRTQIPLLAMIRPREAQDIASSFIADGEQSGWLPKWSVANFQTSVMNGDSADPILSEIYAFGARGFDAATALRQMIHGATQTGRSDNDCYVERQQLDWYERIGYIPHEYDGGLVATPEANGTCTLGVPTSSDRGATALLYGEASATLEYTTDDFALSRMAAMLGNATACRAFLRRSGNWQTLWNATARYLEPRYADGSWVPDYNPDYNDFASATSGFTEGDSAQYTWMVPFDYARLFTLMGGDAIAVKRLDYFLTQLNSDTTGPYAYLGNEPTLETPWIYDWLGTPAKTQQVMRKALLSLYTLTPGGLPGNDDLGTMSSWYVLGAMGLYPEIPGTDLLALTSPLLPQITVHLPHGQLRINAPGAPGATYIRRLKLDGRAYGRPWLRFASVSGGGSLRYRLSTGASGGWGTRRSGLAPSYAPGDTAACGS